jgi:hypothetical protein
MPAICVVRAGWGECFLMVTCRKCACFCSATLAVLFSVAGSHGESKRNPDPGPPPSVRIAVDPLGFTAPSRAYMSYRLSTSTVDFIDKDHLLFTFRERRLLQRVPEDPPNDEDQLICAVVLDIATGKKLQEAHWRMHDRQRYLWALSGGKFLVRQRNSLYLTDEHLELRPYLGFENLLQSIQISPDRKLMVVEVQKILAPPPPADGEAGKTPSLDALFGPAPPVRAKRTEVIMLRPEEKTAIAETETRNPVDLPLIEDGYLVAIEGKDAGKWMIRRGFLKSVAKNAVADDPQTVTEFKSSCQPSLMSVSRSVVLAVGCSPNTGDDHMVTAFSLSGGVLWQDRWKQRYIWPTFDYAEDGSRFAYSSLEMKRVVGMLDSFGEEDITAQRVGVFDTSSGKLVMVRDATPVMSAGQNYALSSDGSRFAILRNGAIEVYDLPLVSAPPATPASQK